MPTIKIVPSDSDEIQDPDEVKTVIRRNPKRCKVSPRLTAQFHGVFSGASPEKSILVWGRQIETLHRKPTVLRVHNFLSANELKWAVALGDVSCSSFSFLSFCD